MIQKQGNWMPHELKPTDMDWHFFMKSYSKGENQKVLVIDKMYITIIPSVENHLVNPAMD